MVKFFVKRPHAIDMFRERADYTKDADPVLLEADLRHLMTVEVDEGRLLPNRITGEFVVRISAPSKPVVYAILVPTPDKEYDYFVPTVLTQEMYQQWSTDGKLNEVGACQKKRMPKFKPMIYLRYKNGDGSEHFDECLVEDLEEYVTRLIKKGVRVVDIEAFKKIPLKIGVSLPGFTP
jgi:hypothetical protein